MSELRITAVEPFILHVPVTGNEIADSTHRISHWGVVGCRIDTAEGISGYGFTGTHAHLSSDQLITACISRCYTPLLLGQSAHDHARLWQTLARSPALQWVGRAGITTLAHAAVDVALWDIVAKAAQQPLWQRLGGAVRESVRAYNTDIGWLSLSDDQLLRGAKQAVDQGFTGIKIKVGSAVERDVARVRAVRQAIGDRVTLAVDGNGKWDLPSCLRFARATADYDPLWFEEPLWYDDVQAHAALAASGLVPVALGEQLYTTDAFAEFMRQQAIHWVQPDVTRMAGITEVLRVCDMAGGWRLPVAPHAGDMSQVHLHLSWAHPACQVLEYIPWIAHCFTDPAHVKDGHFVKPMLPGCGTTPTEQAWGQYRQALS